jgi:MSHA biogenesis protein MshJ
MRLDWKSLAARIDDMSLRERAMLFASASLVILVLSHVLLIEPALRAQKALIERVTRNQTQINAVRAEIEKIVQAEADGGRHPELEAIRALEQRIEQADEAMAQRSREFVAPERLPALLGDMLGTGRQVRLESLKLLPGTPLPQAGGFYRHGVELRLRGSYFDLLAYLEDLEKLPSLVLWGKVALHVERYPEVQLEVVVYTLSRQRVVLSI